MDCFVPPGSSTRGSLLAMTVAGCLNWFRRALAGDHAVRRPPGVDELQAGRSQNRHANDREFGRRRGRRVGALAVSGRGINLFRALRRIFRANVGRRGAAAVSRGPARLAGPARAGVQRPRGSTSSRMAASAGPSPVFSERSCPARSMGRAISGPAAICPGAESIFSVACGENSGRENSGLLAGEESRRPAHGPRRRRERRRGAAIPRPQGVRRPAGRRVPSGSSRRRPPGQAVSLEGPGAESVFSTVCG